MIRHDVAANLLASVEILVTEKEGKSAIRAQSASVVRGLAHVTLRRRNRGRSERMPPDAKMTTKPFQGVRIEVDTSVSIDEVLDRLRQAMGNASAQRLAALEKEATSQSDYVEKLQERFVGESGFMLFDEIDHGAWLPRFGINRRMVRWILGNPLIAITLIRHDATAGLFAPVEILVTEKDVGPGTTLTYVRPSSLMVIEDNPPLREAAKGLDDKLDALVARASGGVVDPAVRSSRGSEGAPGTVAR